MAFQRNALKDKAFCNRLKSCGRDTKIYARARLAGLNQIEIGCGSRIDDFSFVAAGRGVDIGDRVHIASFSSIAGGGEAVLESFSGLAAGCRLITGSEKYMGKSLTNPCVPNEFRTVEHSVVTLRKHVLLFTNVIVFPGVEIGEGAVVSAGSVVPRDLEPWGIYRNKGGRLQRVRDRPRKRILRMEQKCIEKYGY